MNQITIPSPDAIPVNWLWFEILLMVTFFVHMILMNFILGGSLLTVWDLFRGKLDEKSASGIPTIIALTINFGVPPLLFIQVLYGHLFYTSSVVMAVPWIIVIPVLILAYYGAYVFSKRIYKAAGWAKAGLLVSTILLLYIAFMWVNNSTLAMTPERWNIYFDRPGGNSLNLGEPTLWPRFLHFIIAAIAIGALGRAIYYHFTGKKSDEGKEQVKRNLKIFGWFTLVQFAVGTWFWLSMPKEVWKDFMGDNLLATIFMAAGWLGALLILHFSFNGKFNASMILGGFQVVLMILIRDIARRAYLESYFQPGDLAVDRQVSPLIVFLIVFLVGLAVLYYMIRLMSKPKTPQQ